MSGDTLSQEEIEALLNESQNDGADGGTSASSGLTDIERDALGEVGNISLGTSATTLSTLLNQSVNITSPTVKMMNWKDISDSYDRPCVGVKIDYTVGIKGSNVLVLRNSDVKIITDLMMGGTGIIEKGDDELLTEIDLSAIGEAMNQMIGSASTSLSSFVQQPRVDIATPRVFEIDFSNEEFFSRDLGLEGEEVVAVTVFNLTIGDLINSEIMQIYPIEFALDLTSKLLGGVGTDEPAPAAAPAPSHAPGPAPQQQSAPAPQQQMQQPQAQPQGGYPPQMDPQYGAAPMYQQQGYPQQPMHPQGGYNMQPQMGMPMSNFNPQDINAAPAQFQSFDMASMMHQQKENIDILMDVPLEVTVELGKTSKRIKEILEFSPGTIIELDKLAGEPIDILVNGKYVAKGEVVVIDENFGIRVTSIISPELRI